MVIDQGETDWKVIAIDVTDPIASMLQDIDDVERCLPGFLDSLKNWYRQYRVPEGKGENQIGLGGELKDQRYAFLCAAVNFQSGSWDVLTEWWCPGLLWILLVIAKRLGSRKRGLV